MPLVSTYLFADLQLDVKGCRDVYASFDKYVEVERLEGDNKYHAEEHGLQVSYECLMLTLCNCALNSDLTLLVAFFFLSNLLLLHLFCLLIRFIYISFSTLKAFLGGLVYFML